MDLYDYWTHFEVKKKIGLLGTFGTFWAPKGP